MKNQKPTQERLKELFHYDPETGVFTRRSGAERGPKTRKYGRVGAGSISTLGYVMVMVDGVKWIAGSLAWLYVHGEWPDGRIKYINGNPLDNRLANIRVQNKSADEVKSQPMTQERLKALLDYEPESGWFRWRINSSVAKPGERAGTGHGLGYRSIGLDYKKYLEHSLAWLYVTGEYPTFEIDHINGDKADNRWVNLRKATRSENGHNKPNGRKGALGFPGVHKHGSGYCKYRAQIEVDGEYSYFGTHSTIAGARIARLLGEISLFGRVTSWVQKRDSKLPVGDKTIEVRVDGDKIFVTGTDGSEIQVTDAKQIELLFLKPS